MINKIFYEKNIEGFFNENKNPNVNKLKKNKKLKSKKKFENIVPIPKQINQAKGDEFDNDNNFFLMLIYFPEYLFLFFC